MPSNKPPADSRTGSFATRRPICLLLLSALVIVTPFALWRIFACASDLTPDVRSVVIERLTGHLKLGSSDRLDWAPALGVSGYRLGSVFVPGENFIRLSENCDEVKSMTTDGQRKLLVDWGFDLSPQGTFPPLLSSAVAARASVEAQIRAASRIRYSITTTDTEVVMSRQTLVRNLVDDADCLADIASRPVHVLAARVLGEESYEIEQSLTSKVLLTLRELFSAGGHSAQSQTTVIRDGTPRVLLWAFTEMVLTDERIPDDATDSFRRRAARDLTATETEYWRVAEQNTAFQRPSDEFYEQLQRSVAALNGGDEQ